jgi:hypothetical protein
VKLAELLAPVLLDAGAAEQAFTDALTAYEATRRPINTDTIRIAHANAVIAGPGQEPYEQAVEFYGKAASDPNWVRQWMSDFGGRVR